jgi:hypothetical protein
MSLVPGLESLLSGVQRRAAEAGVFADVSIRDGVLICRARDAAAPASYRLFADGGRLWVSLVMADRWLSESIETDLLHTGDKIEELIDEELHELGHAGGPLPVEHFRSDDLLFTFRSPVPAALGVEAADVATKFLLAYEACFRNLGDMAAGGEDE